MSLLRASGLSVGYRRGRKPPLTLAAGLRADAGSRASWSA